MSSVGTVGILGPCRDSEVSYVTDTRQSLSSESIGANRRKIFESFEL